MKITKTYLLKSSLFLAVLFLSVSCKNEGKSKTKEKEKSRIAIAGLGLEASVFSPAKTHEEDFRPQYGTEVFKAYPFFDKDSSLIDQAEWVPTIIGHAMPGGQATKEAYESLVRQTLDSLEQNLPLDGIYFDVHGAMSVEGMDDPEGDFITRIRKVVGDDVMISTSMDLHGSVSHTLAENTDLITAFRMAPHEDRWETKRRAIDNLLDRLKNDKGKPKYKALVPVPILLAGEQTSTRVEPGKSLYAKIPELIDKDKMIDVSIWMSYPWGDQPRNTGVVVAYGDDKDAVQNAVEALAEYFWEVREKFDFVAPTLNFEDAIEKAIESDKKPFILSDMGDNPTAGGAGDVTWTLKELLKLPGFSSDDGKSWIYASIPGKNFIDKAKEAGVGAEVEAEVGGLVDDKHAGPVKLKGTVSAINEDDYNTTAAVKVGKSIVIVTEKRASYQKIKQFTDLDIEPEKADVLVVKQGYLVPELYNIRADWVMALTPGGVDQDLFRLDYQNIKRPMYPLDKDMEDPDLKAQFIPLADELNN